MKSKKINMQAITIIVLIGIIISLIFVILNMKNKNIVQQEAIKEQLGETTDDNAYVGLQSHLSEVNDKEQKLVAFKSEIASAITDMGITTSENADATTMSSNIRSFANSLNAASIKYDNTNSGLASTNVQGAVNELNGEIDELNNSLTELKNSVSKKANMNDDHLNQGFFDICGGTDNHDYVVRFWMEKKVIEVFYKIKTDTSYTQVWIGELQ